MPEHSDNLLLNWVLEAGMNEWMKRVSIDWGCVQRMIKKDIIDDINLLSISFVLTTKYSLFKS